LTKSNAEKNKAMKQVLFTFIASAKGFSLDEKIHRLMFLSILGNCAGTVVFYKYYLILTTERKLHNFFLCYPPEIPLKS